MMSDTEYQFSRGKSKFGKYSTTPKKNKQKKQQGIQKKRLDGI